MGDSSWPDTESLRTAIAELRALPGKEVTIVTLGPNKADETIEEAIYSEFAGDRVEAIAQAQFVQSDLKNSGWPVIASIFTRLTTVIASDFISSARRPTRSD